MFSPILPSPDLYASGHGYAPDIYSSLSIEIVKSAPVNSFYGHSSIVRRYCGYPADMPLPIIIQHGTVGLSQDFYELRDWFNSESLNHYWGWNVRAYEYARQINSPFTVEVLGSPFLYLVRMIRQLVNQEPAQVPDAATPNVVEFRHYLLDIKHKRESSTRDKKYRLVFAPHSIPSCILPLSAHAEFANHLEKNLNLLPSVICLHPFDVFLGNHLAYEKLGFKVVCCMNSAISGYPWNEREFWANYHKIGIEYLLNLYGLLILASTIYSCGLSTPLFYAGYLNKKCKLLNCPCPPTDGPDPFSLIRDIMNTNTPCDLDLTICPSIRQILDIDSCAPYPMQVFNEYCRYVLGADHLIGPVKMLRKLTSTYELVSQGDS